jgi:hypothetical protein
LFASSLLWQSAHRLRSGPSLNAVKSPLCGSTWSATVAGVTRPAYQPKAIAAMPELGDGVLHRTITRIQREFFDPSDVDRRMPRGAVIKARPNRVGPVLCA